MTSSRSNHALLRVFYHLLRVGLGVVFIWASWGKIADPAAFAQVVQNYQILPPALVNPTAVILPWIEAVCGICLITGVLARGSLALFSGLMAVFTLALIWNAWRGIDTDCGCFSVAVQADKGRYLEYILRDLAILGAGIWALWYRLTLRTEAGSGLSKTEA